MPRIHGVLTEQSWRKSWLHRVSSGRLRLNNYELPARYSVRGATVLETYQVHHCDGKRCKQCLLTGWRTYRYAKYILAAQELASERTQRPVRLPLAVMTSDAPHGIAIVLMEARTKPSFHASRCE